MGSHRTNIAESEIFIGCQELFGLCIGRGPDVAFSELSCPSVCAEAAFGGKKIK